MSNALMLFTIGPVQQFVGPSRKLKDLYSGSFLLSHLAIQAKEFFEKKQVKVIIPAPNIISAPNRLVVQVENIEEAEQLAKAVNTHVHQEFLNISKKVFEKSNLMFTQEVKQQLETFLETNWVVQQNDGTFQTNYKNLLVNMHGIKNTRMFKQITEKPGRKCDLYEQYNALITSNEKSLQNLQRTNLKRGENLSAIALVKRNLDKCELQYFDMEVSSVAYMLLKSYLPSTVNLDKLKDEGSEALFDLKNNEDISKYKEYKTETKQTALGLYDQYSNKIGSPYYAIVKLDGDGVGTKYQEVTSIEVSQSLSEAISGFSKKAKEIIEENQGVCVFAGGEDILAFFPLHKLFKALSMLIKEFGMIKELNYQGTLSAGIIITHLMTPLKPLLEQVESLEAHAKAIDEDKAAFSMNIIRRGGLTTPLRMKFGKDGENLKVIEELIKALHLQENSTSFIQNVLTLLTSIKSTVNEEMLIVLLRKLLKNSLANASLVEKQLGVFISVYEVVDKDIESFLSLLQQSTFLARNIRKEQPRGRLEIDV